MANDDNERQAGERLALGLGWFSIGLGLAEVAAPGSVARLIGISDDESTGSVLRTMGAREIGNGLAILAQPDKAGWLWSRVAGDVMDLSALGSAFSRDDADPRRLLGATAAVLGVTMLDLIAARQLSRGADAEQRTKRSEGLRVERVTTVNRPIEDVYEFWRNFQNFPRFMRHLESVRILDNKRSHWVAKAPAGRTVEWDAEIVVDRENEWIAWRSLEGADVPNRGSVRFERAPGARGTEVRVQLEYSPPAGRFGRTVAWLFGEEPDQQIHEDLHRFKQLVETGEIPLSDGLGLWRAAQPVGDAAKVRALAGVDR
jgi:uncharacterized membrane protein